MRGYPSPAVRPELRNHLLDVRKSPRLIFREDEVLALANVKNALAAFDQSDFLSGQFLNFRSQTGCLWLIASNDAVSDAEIHFGILRLASQLSRLWVD